MGLDIVGFVFQTIRIVVFALVVVVFVAFLAFFASAAKQDDLGRFSIEMSENILSSRLTTTKYIFDRAQLSVFNQPSVADKQLERYELQFARSCEFGYFATVEDLASGEEWKFGYIPSDLVDNNEQGRKDIVYRVGINVPNPQKPADFYSSVTPALFTLIAFDSRSTRITCAIEKSFRLKEIQNVTIGECLHRFQLETCLGLKRETSGGIPYACFYSIESGSDFLHDCRYMPLDINFQQFHETYDSLKEKGIDPSEDLVVKTYPIKEGLSIPDCQTLKENFVGFLPDENEEVQTVVICLENKK